MHPGLGWDLGKRVPTLRERSQQPPASPGCETEQPEGAEWGKRPPRPLGPARGMLGQSREPLCRHELPERKRPPGPVHTLTGTRKDICIFLIGAQQAHQLRGLHVVQGEEADVILGAEESRHHLCTPTSPRMRKVAGTQLGVKSPQAAGSISGGGPSLLPPSHHPRERPSHTVTQHSGPGAGAMPGCLCPGRCLLKERLSIRMWAREWEGVPSYLNVFPMSLLLAGGCLPLVGGVRTQGTPDGQPGKGVQEMGGKSKGASVPADQAPPDRASPQSSFQGGAQAGRPTPGWGTGGSARNPTWRERCPGGP